MLGTELYADLALYISITFLAQIFFGWGMEGYTLLLPSKFKDNASGLSKAVSSLFTFSLLLGIVLIVFSFFLGETIFDLVFTNHMAFFPFGFLSVVTAFFNSYFKIHNNLLLSEKKVNTYIIGNIINFVATLSISLIGLFMFRDTLWGPILGRLLSGVIIFLLAAWFFLSKYKFSIDKAFLKTAMQYAVPMLIFYIFNWVMGYYDRIIIENNLTKEDLAVYDFTSKCVAPLDFLQNGLFAAIAPIIYGMWQDNKMKESTPETNRYFNGYSAVFLLLIPLLCFFIPLIVPLVIKKTIYYDSFLYLGIMAATYCFRAYYMIYYFVLTFYNKTKIIPVVFCILSVVQVILMEIGARYFGIMGILFSALIVKIIQPMIFHLFSRKLYTFKFNKLKIIFLPLLFSLIVVVCQYFITRENFYVIYGLQFLFAAFAIFLVYKKELLFVANKYLKKT
jgi:O-antigen/teichoic acid export membrane protein